MISAEVKMNGVNLVVFSVYAPQEHVHKEDKAKQTRTKDAFWDELTRRALKIKKKTQLLILGDLNATSSAITHAPTFYHGQTVENIINNDNGHRLTRFLAETKLHVASSYFSHKPAHSYTYYSYTNEKTKKILDLALQSNFLQKRCLDSRTKRGYDFQSDHRLVVTRYRFERRRMNRPQKKPKIKKKPDFKAVTDDHKKNFLEAIENATFKSAQDFIENLDKAVETLPKLGKKSTEKYPWNDNPELESLLKERKKYHIKNDRKQYRKLSGRIRNLVNSLRNQHFEEEAARFNEAEIRRDIEKAYKIAKSQKTTRRKQGRDRPVPGLKNHFQQHFNHTVPTDLPTILQKPLNQPKIPGDYLVGAPTVDELKNVILQAKNGKASLDIPIEAVKIATECPRFLELLSEFYGEIWVDGDVPPVLGESEITAIWKRKGSKQECKTWRGIMLSSTLTKILATLIINRICTTYDLNISEGQMGFRPNRGCMDGSYCLKRVHQWGRKAQTEIFCGMVDLSAAFDWCPRPFVFASARLIVGDSIMIDILENMYTKTVAWLKGENERFDCTCGVRQGGSESTVLYNCLAQTCMDTWVDRCEQKGLKKFKIPYKIPKNVSKSGADISGFCEAYYLAYADDLCIFSLDADDLEKKLQLLNEVFKEFGLVMNMDKTETLIYNWELGKNVTEKYPKSICKIDDIEIKNSLDFKYLGAFSQIDDSSIGSVELEYRITSGTCKFFELKQFFKNRNIKMETRVKYMNSLVRTRMCYLSQGWTITKAQVQKLQSNYNKFLRYIVPGGLKRQPVEQYTRKDGTTGEFSKYALSGEEIQKRSKSETIQSYITRQQTTWIGHIMRSDDKCFIKQLTYPDYLPGTKKKPGVLNTTYRQVRLHYEKDLNLNENEMTEKLLKRKR